MANEKFSKGMLNYYLEKAKRHGFGESSNLYKRLKSRDGSAAYELDSILSDRNQGYKDISKIAGIADNAPILSDAMRGDPKAIARLNEIREAQQSGVPLEQALMQLNQGRGNLNSPDYYKDFNRFPESGEAPRGSFFGGRPEFRENIDTLTPLQRQYSNILLNRAMTQVPQSLDALGDLANQGFLDRLLFKGASQGFGNALKSLGDVDPTYIGGALGGLSSGQGISGILSGLIGNALGSYAQKNFPTQSAMNILGNVGNNVSSGAGNLFRFFSGLN